MSWFIVNPLVVVPIVITVVAMLAAIIIFTRLAGLRTFSKMSSYDFAVTVAFGSLIAATALNNRPSLFEGLIALGTLIICQYAISHFRVRQSGGEFTDNEPLLLMVDGEFLDDALKDARITKDDIYAKLRQANVFDDSEVRAVVLETTGDVSVLQGDKTLNPDLLTGVRNRQLFAKD